MTTVPKVQPYGKRIEEHRKVLDQLKTLSIENMACAAAIMDSFLSEKVIVKLQSEAEQSPVPEVKNTSHDRDGLQNLLADKLFEWLADSQRINREHDEFCTRIVENDKPIEDLTPFLSQVWSGEMYGESKYDGLRRLLEEVNVTNTKLKELSKTPSVSGVFN